MDIFSEQLKKECSEIKKIEKEMNVLYEKKYKLESELAKKYNTDWAVIKTILDRIK